MHINTSHELIKQYPHDYIINDIISILLLKHIHYEIFRFIYLSSNSIGILRKIQIFDTHLYSSFHYFNDLATCILKTVNYSQVIDWYATIMYRV